MMNWRLKLSKVVIQLIERLIPVGEQYVPNDILLDPEDCQIIILTGPNMSGKSALLRQTTLS